MEPVAFFLLQVGEAINEDARWMGLWSNECSGYWTHGQDFEAEQAEELRRVGGCEDSGVVSGDDLGGGDEVEFVDAEEAGYLHMQCVNRRLEYILKSSYSL